MAGLERLINKVRGFSATPRDLVGLASSLEIAPRMRELLCGDDDIDKVDWIAQDLKDMPEVVELVRRAINDDPPPSVGDGRVTLGVRSVWARMNANSSVAMPRLRRSFDSA